jgi:hypothetical protein
VGERLDVGAVPEAGVGEDDLGRVGDAGRLEFLAGGGDHRLEAVALVAASDDVGGDDDLPFGGDGLRGVALQKPRAVLTGRESGSVMLMRPVGAAGIGRGFGGAPIFVRPGTSTPQAACAASIRQTRGSPRRRAGPVSRAHSRLAGEGPETM